MRRAIVIGGSGFLGKHLLSHLHKEDVEIIAIINKTIIPSTNTLETIDGGIATVNIQLINDFEPDVIFHCARPTIPRYRKLGRKLAAKKAFKLNKKLIENIKQSKHQTKLIFASGSLMYGNSNNPHNELSPLNPISYARQYYKGEIPISEAVKENSFPIIVLRFPWLLGNGSWFKWFYLENIKKHKIIPEFGKGDNLMEIIDVQDAAILMKHYSEQTTQSGIFNICQGKPIKHAKFLTEIKAVLGGEIRDYKSVFPKGLEKEAMEAFTSNITLSSLHPEILDNFEFSSLKETLKRIITESQTD